MAEYTLRKEQKAFAFDRTIAPVLTIDSGDTVTFETGDFAYERLSKGEAVEAIGLENFNAVTGPVYVNGAVPGDALRVEVLDVQVRRAWSVWLPGFGGLGAHTTSTRVREIPLRDGRAHISESVSTPIRPMIGCIGVAPGHRRERRADVPSTRDRGLPDLDPGDPDEVPALESVERHY